MNCRRVATDAPRPAISNPSDSLVLCPSHCLEVLNHRFDRRWATFLSDPQRRIREGRDPAIRHSMAPAARNAERVQTAGIGHGLRSCPARDKGATASMLERVVEAPVPHPVGSTRKGDTNCLSPAAPPLAFLPSPLRPPHSASPHRLPNPRHFSLTVLRFMAMIPLRTSPRVSQCQDPRVTLPTSGARSGDLRPLRTWPRLKVTQSDMLRDSADTALTRPPVDIWHQRFRRHGQSMRTGCTSISHFVCDVAGAAT